MVVHKRSKRTRARGSWSHGWGAKDRHRGAGSRGGRGHAGSSAQKAPAFWARPWFGKVGFVPRGPREKIRAVDILWLERNFEKLREAKLAKPERQAWSIDLAQLGINKLLGLGKPTRAYKIKVRHASKSAVEAIVAGGGELSLACEEKREERGGAR